MGDAPEYSQAVTYAEFMQLDALIALAVERGIDLGERVKTQSDVCCCGAVAATARRGVVFEERDQEIIRRIAELEEQIESAPTLGQLIEIRDGLLRRARD
jgi:hypothetical protein